MMHYSKLKMVMMLMSIVMTLRSCVHSNILHYYCSSDFLLFSFSYRVVMMYLCFLCYDTNAQLQHYYYYST